MCAEPPRNVPDSVPAHDPHAEAASPTDQTFRLLKLVLDPSSTSFSSSSSCCCSCPSSWRLSDCSSLIASKVHESV